MYDPLNILIQNVYLKTSELEVSRKIIIMGSENWKIRIQNCKINY